MTELLYDNPLAADADIRGFVAEGPAAVDFSPGRMRLTSLAHPGEGQAANLVLWCPEPFPDHIEISWDFYPVRDPGLCMLFFAASGRDGTDLFDPSLQPRTGIYRQYHSGDIRGLHVTYFHRKAPEVGGEGALSLDETVGAYARYGRFVRFAEGSLHRLSPRLRPISACGGNECGRFRQEERSRRRIRVRETVRSLYPLALEAVDMAMRIQPGDIVLFQGDSITDAGRNRESSGDLGRGYALMAAGLFGSLHPERRATFLNRGISGNRVKDLQARWQDDCIGLRPNWVSIYIGINDCWRRYDRNDPTSVEQFERGYRELLTRTKEELGAGIVMVEPFVLPVPEDRKAWREDLDPKINAVRELAREFGALLVPLDGLFAQASMTAPPAYWAPDGVHPSPAGHALIARAWLQAVGAVPLGR